MKFFLGLFFISILSNVKSLKDCAINEKFNKLGPGLCETHKDCKGDRACSLIGKCFGKSNCRKQNKTIIYKLSSCYNKEKQSCKSD